MQTVKRHILCDQSSRDVASDVATVSSGGTVTAGSNAAIVTTAMATIATTTVATATTSVTTADTVAAAAFFDAVEDSDSSASSDILQMNEVCATVTFLLT